MAPAQPERPPQRHTAQEPVRRPMGIPAHITILFPFMPPAYIDDAVLHRLAGIFAAVPAFEHRLVRTSWFGEDVVPHLTIADRCPLDQMQAAAVLVEKHLPISCVARGVSLVVQRDASGAWTRSASFALGEVPVVS